MYDSTKYFFWKGRKLRNFTLQTLQISITSLNSRFEHNIRKSKDSIQCVIVVAKSTVNEQNDNNEGDNDASNTMEGNDNQDHEGGTFHLEIAMRFDGCVSAKQTNNRGENTSHVSSELR